MVLLPQWRRGHVVIGMVHLSALPGSPGFGGDVAAVLQRALRDAGALAEGGVDGIMIENFGDTPFYPGLVPAWTVAHMTAVAGAIRQRWPEAPLGINALRNDGQSALAIAHAVGAKFIRVNVLTGARVTDQGLIQGIAHELLRERAMLKADEIRIFADVDVKHSAALAPRPLEEEIADTVERGGADALVVSGTGTGRPTDLGKAQRAKTAAPQTPLFIGSGATVATVGEFRPHVDGFIVGTAFKRDGRVEEPVDVGRVREFMRAVR